MRTPNLSPTDRRAYGIRETAAMLGVSPNHVLRAIKRGELRAVRLGQRWLIPQDAIDALLAGEGER